MMREGVRSLTAEAAAFERAAHLRWDDTPALFVDDRVETLLSAPARMLLRLPRPMSRSRLAPKPVEKQLRTQILLRSRYTEDRLSRLLAQGLGQYVILAAGLDTFALRRADLRASGLRVFELDQPDTQRWKRQRLGSRVPPDLEFIGIDFERESIAGALRRSSWKPEQPTFFSWLGITYYLTREAIRATLSSIAGVAAPGSELVCDYWSNAPEVDWRSRLLLGGVRFAVALQSEPMRSFFTPSEIASEACTLGYRVKANVSPAELRRRYLRRRSDGLDVPEFGYLLHLALP